MDVASLELCKELYELSGWEYDNFLWTTGKPWHETQEEPYIITEDLANWNCQEYNGVELEYKIAPAYDLGYLLRKLPRATLTPAANWLALFPADANGHQWMAKYEYMDIAPDDQKIRAGSDLADSPEDAAAQLAIELFKQGILEKAS